MPTEMGFDVFQSNMAKHYFHILGGLGLGKYLTINIWLRDRGPKDQIWGEKVLRGR